jgi:hypothetical protein
MSLVERQVESRSVSQRQAPECVDRRIREVDVSGRV